MACVLRQIADALDVLRSGAAAEAVGIDESGTLSSHGLIIDGKSLLYIFEDEGAKAGFLQLAMLCDSVICCRVSPKQKSQVRPIVFLFQSAYSAFCTSAVTEYANRSRRHLSLSGIRF